MSLRAKLINASVQVLGTVIGLVIVVVAAPFLIIGQKLEDWGGE